MRKGKELGWDGNLPSPKPNLTCWSQRGTSSYAALKPLQRSQGSAAPTQGWTGAPLCALARLPSPAGSGPLPSSRSWLPVGSRLSPAR